ncbi:MAG TPA: hypothetical protein V6D50_08855 [Chroococcales cyanobacterium]
MLGDKTSFSKMIGLTCLGALSMLIVSSRVDRFTFTPVRLAADTIKLNPVGYLTADNDGDDDDDCKTRKANYSLADNDGDDDDDDCQTRRTNSLIASQRAGFILESDVGNS